MTPLNEIAERLHTQNNRITENPMFCVQIKVRDIGYNADYSDGGNTCWRNFETDETVYEEPDDTDGWEEFGFVDRWETVMVAFTEKGCEEYLALDGHNCRSRAHNREVRIYVESFNRCNEMIAIRSAIMKGELR